MRKKSKILSNLSKPVTMILWFLFFYLPLGIFVGGSLHYFALILMNKSVVIKDSLYLVMGLTALSGFFLVLIVWMGHGRYFQFGPKNPIEILVGAFTMALGFALVGAMSFSFMEWTKEGLVLLIPQLKMGLILGLLLSVFLFRIQFSK